MTRLQTMILMIILLALVGCNKTESFQAQVKVGKSENLKFNTSLIAKYKSTLHNMRRIGSGINSYINDHHTAPGDLTFGSPLIRDFHVGNSPEKDSWRNNWHYKRDEKDKKKFWFGSSGSDGRFKGFDQKGFYKYITSKDIIYSGKEIVYGPEGTEDRIY